MMDELELVKRVRPDARPPDREVRAAARRALDEVIARQPRTRRGVGRKRVGLWALVPVLGAVVVLAVGAVFLSVHTRKTTTTASRNVSQFVFGAQPLTGHGAVSSRMMSRALDLVRLRLEGTGARVSLAGDRLLVAVSRKVSPARVLAAVQSSGLLALYDWEANVLAPSGKPVAGLLQAKDPTAITISQGSAASPPGSAGAAAMTLYDAVKLAAKQPQDISRANSRTGSEAFLFGKARSHPCAVAARYYRVTRLVGQPCYLGGPADPLSGLVGSLPPGISASQGQELVVKQGWVVLQGVPNSFSHEPGWSDPNPDFFVLRDHVALLGTDITNPQQSTDQSGQPDVAFGFTSKGATEFQNVTAAIAKRGQLVSGLGRKLFQHFAVALGTQLITVPFIDYGQNPFGIPGENGADIQGGFTKSSARQLAAELRLGPFPVALNLIAIKSAPAR